MAQTMSAAVLHGAGNLVVQEWRQPELKSGFVLVRVRRAGICGSDIHYFAHGRCGAFVPTGPFVLGHEACGEVAAVGANVAEPREGDQVVINPARACGRCDHCRGGRGNLCRRTIMLGSASTTPPTDGALAEYVAVRADQCHIMAAGMDDSQGAMMEPLAVALHAVKRAGAVAGRGVLITGGGPIGLLTLAVARACGAVPVVLTDLVADRRSAALNLGADAVLDPSAPDANEQAGRLVRDGFDVVFEASGAPPALRQAIDLARPGGTIVQIGTLAGGDVPLPANQIMARELQYIGSFRYGNVFDEAIRLVQAGRIDLRPFVSRVWPLRDVEKAIRFAAAREQTIKVQVAIDQDRERA